MAYSGHGNWSQPASSSSIETEPSMENQHRANYLHTNYKLLVEKLYSHDILESISEYLPENDRTRLQNIYNRGELAIELMQTVEQNVSNRAMYDAFLETVSNLQPDLYNRLRESQQSNESHQSVEREFSSWDTNRLVQQLNGSEILDAIGDYLPAGKLEELESITIKHVQISEIIDLVQTDQRLSKRFMNYLMESHPDVHEMLLENRIFSRETVVEECGPPPSQQPRKRYAEPTGSLPIHAPTLNPNCERKVKSENKGKRGMMDKVSLPWNKKFKQQDTHIYPPEEVEIDIASTDPSLVVTNIPDLNQAEEDSIGVLTLLKPIPEDKDITDDLCKAIAFQPNLKGFHINGRHLSEQSVLKLLKCLSELHNLDTMTFHGIHCFEVCAPKFIVLLSDKKSLSHLALNQCHIPETSWEGIARALYDMPNLEELSLNDTAMKDVGAKWLTDGLNANTSLKSLSLKNNQISDWGLHCIAQCLQNKQHLELLSLANNHITDEGVAHLAAVGHNYRRHACHVDLSGNQLGNEGARIILTKWPSPAQNVHHFNFDQNQIKSLSKTKHMVSMRQNKYGGNRVQVLVDRISKGESFRYIDLSSMDLKDDDIKTLCICLCSVGTLESLNLKDNNLTRKSLAGLTRIYHRCKNLLFINIERNRIANPEVEQLFTKQLNHIRHRTRDVPFFLSEKMNKIINDSNETCLHLQNENIKVNCIPIMLDILGDRSFEEIKVEDCSLWSRDVKSLWSDPSVTKSICFAKNGFKDAHIGALTDEFPRSRMSYGLRRSTPCDVNMALTHFEITGNGIKTESIKIFANTVFRCKNLSFVKLADNSIGVSGCKTLEEYLAGNPPLRSLCLAGNGLGDEGTKYLCKGLHSNKNLHHLNLVKTGISSNGSYILGELLGKNRSIQFLDISDNSIEDLNDFSTGLAQNKSLHTLCLSANFIGDSSITFLWRSLTMNNTLCKIDISNNDIHAAGFPAVIGALSNRRITHCDIGGNPGIGDYIKQNSHEFIPGILLLKYLGLRCLGIPDQSMLELASAAARHVAQMEPRKIETHIDISGRTMSRKLSHQLTGIRVKHPSMRFLVDCRDYKKEYFGSPF